MINVCVNHNEVLITVKHQLSHYHFDQNYLQSMKLSIFFCFKNLIVACRRKNRLCNGTFYFMGCKSILKCLKVVSWQEEHNFYLYRPTCWGARIKGVSGTVYVLNITFFYYYGQRFRELALLAQGLMKKKNQFEPAMVTAYKVNVVDSKQTMSRDRICRQ